MVPIPPQEQVGWAGLTRHAAIRHKQLFFQRRTIYRRHCLAQMPQMSPYLGPCSLVVAAAVTLDPATTTEPADIGVTVLDVTTLQSDSAVRTLWPHVASSPRQRPSPVVAVPEQASQAMLGGWRPSVWQDSSESDATIYVLHAQLHVRQARFQDVAKCRDLRHLVRPRQLLARTALLLRPKQRSRCTGAVRHVVSLMRCSNFVPVICKTSVLHRLVNRWHTHNVLAAVATGTQKPRVSRHSMGTNLPLNGTDPAFTILCLRNLAPYHQQRERISVSATGCQELQYIGHAPIPL
jgi:hypothetical protein